MGVGGTAQATAAMAQVISRAVNMSKKFLAIRAVSHVRIGPTPKKVSS